ncbi:MULTISPECIES: helix-turn-helix domain-containing protein [Microbacterium]|uniref:Transcriptional regulator n=1 Tax=Microbacterium barkeri TaxID=33917 RepID=A0A9W6LVL6_9MICO|nr:XRE family transcriptional regulator [Microbacterium barkeri]MDR6877707.1 transcriptional regulator with XRE-family HTH domain [Microbacterium barkeri]GLJ60864.1 transcriptional regulator [Microbacterium barkeri]
MSDPHAREPVAADSRLERTVGNRVRHHRLAAGLTASDLAARSGLSPAMISRIESATTSASLTTIHRLARALEVPVASLFRGADAPRAAIVVKAGGGTESVRAGSRQGHRYASLGNLLSTSGPSLEPVIVTLNAEAAEFPLYEHAGIEFLYMLEGAVLFRHGDDEHVLEAGDSILLDAETPHGPTAVIAGPARFLSVNPAGA